VTKTTTEVVSCGYCKLSAIGLKVNEYAAKVLFGRNRVKLESLHGVQGVGGSNPLAPTKKAGHESVRLFLCLVRPSLGGASRLKPAMLAPGLHRWLPPYGVRLWPLRGVCFDETGDLAVCGGMPVVAGGMSGSLSYPTNDLRLSIATKDMGDVGSGRNPMRLKSMESSWKSRPVTSSRYG
jgi:hypothetical protein